MDVAELTRRVDAAAADGSVAARHNLLLELDAREIEAMLHGSLSTSSAETLIASGIGASPGAARGRAYFTIDDAMDGFDRGESVIFMRPETSPADEPAMRIADGIITSGGGLASHAAVVARGWGVPAVCGAQALTVTNASATCGAVTIEQGDEISIDGATGEIFLGSIDIDSAHALGGELEALLGWADEVRGDRFGVRANADTAEDVAQARAFGAEGVGLCRTEHQFLGDRASLVARLVIDDDLSVLDELFAYQVADFAGILQAMDGRPVTVRLLDAPLHEFLSGLEGPDIADWQEVNPMLGSEGFASA